MSTLSCCHKLLLYYHHYHYYYYLPIYLLYPYLSRLELFAVNSPFVVSLGPADIVFLPAMAGLPPAEAIVAQVVNHHNTAMVFSGIENPVWMAKKRWSNDVLKKWRVCLKLGVFLEKQYQARVPVQTLCFPLEGGDAHHMDRKPWLQQKIDPRTSVVMWSKVIKRFVETW